MKFDRPGVLLRIDWLCFNLRFAATSSKLGGHGVHRCAAQAVANWLA
jgi:hypothetical protein